jgi:tRNA (cmo5U34)-methyltransferase
MDFWSDATVARQWAADNPEDNPARKQVLDLLLKIIADHFQRTDVPRRVLDLGCGHGVIAARILRELPDATLTGVDGYQPMLALAEEQLSIYPGRYTLAQVDFAEMAPAALGGGPFGVAIAVQAIHNCTDEAKQKTLASAQAVLAPGGLFLLVDRIRLAAPALFGVYRSVWDALGPTWNNQQAEGDTLAEHERIVVRQGDKPGSLEQNILWLREAGFTQVAAVHVVGIRALIAATK